MVWHGDVATAGRGREFTKMGGQTGGQTLCVCC